MTPREDCAPVTEIEDHRATRRVVDLAPSDEEVMARAAEHLARHDELLQQAQYHSERAQELLAPLNRELAYRHEAELAVEEKLPEGES